MTGEVIAGRYRLVDPIGTGGSGTVWRAVDLERNAWCAAKLLRQRDAGDLLRFVREQAVRLHHPHIVSPYAWSADDGSVLLATELVDGGSLQTLLGDWGPLSDGTISVILEQLLSALVEVHRAELIHRDVKPGNILLRASGDGPIDTALTDFGLTVSARDARLTATGMVIGTPGYLPPELLAGRVTPEPGHDVYAVGRLAIALAAGESRTSHDPAELFTDPVLRVAVAAMVAADPADRPVDAAAALRSLAGAERHPNPRTRDGEPVTVLHQLPELVPAGKPEPTRIEAVPPPSLQVATREPAAVVADRPGDLRNEPTATIQPRTRRPVWPYLAGLAVLLAVAVAVAVALNAGDDPTTPTDTTVSSEEQPPGSEVVGSEGAELTGDDAPTGSAPPTTANLVPPTDAAAVAGESCDWQLGGESRSTADGAVVVCRLVEGRYLWQP